MNKINSKKIYIVTVSIFVLMTIALMGVASAKSLYVIADINAYPNIPIEAYDIQSAPNYLTLQTTLTVPDRDGGAVGIAIDTDSEVLFITFEQFTTSYDAKIDLLDASTMTHLGQVTAPGAHNLAGIVVDQDNQKVYAVDRDTNNLYVYSWDATTKTLTNDITTFPYYKDLPGVIRAYGLAIDEVNDLLYVGDVTTLTSDSVKIYHTANWSSAGSFSVSQKAMDIAVDVANGFVYTGNAYPPLGSLGLLSKYDLNTNVETTVNIRTLSGGISSDNVIGLAVDPATSLVYITTGHQGIGGSDRIMVFDSNLNHLHSTGDIGNPTGIVVPGKDVSYNPLNLDKDDGVSVCAGVGNTIDYTISYTNGNLYDVTQVTITDTLPAEVDYTGPTTWNIGTLTPGQSGSVTLAVTVNSNAIPGGQIDNPVTINANEVGTGPTTQHEITNVCTNQPPTITDLTVTPGLVAVGDTVALNATFTDPDSGDTHTATINWGDGSPVDDLGSVTSPISDTNSYADAGVYTVTLTVTDDDGGSDTETFQYVVVYDPSAGFVTGGGWINSPAGAYAADTNLEGTANFGFVSRYKKGQTTPTGNTEFRYKIGDLSFHSNNYEWLVVASYKAMYKGTGTINGAGNYGFMISVSDEKLTTAFDVDRFRIKIWDKVDNDAVVYDNNIGDDLYSDPTTDIAGGQIVIHKK